MAGGEMAKQLFGKKKDKKKKNKELEREEKLLEREFLMDKARGQNLFRVPSPTRIPPNTSVQDNILQCFRQNSRAANPASPDPKVRFANMASRLDANDVPVLHGQPGVMAKTPVTVQRTEQHATISGSEFLGALTLTSSQVTLGDVVLAVVMNPRSFDGTKLTQEAMTWQKYRFRRFIVEYIPIQGSTTVGSFVGYFTNDPAEPTMYGTQAVRNAVEHNHAVMFQPFFYNIFGYTEDEVELKTLYFCGQDPGGDARLEIQSMFKMVNATTNTATSFGNLMIHYECDFYYPELVKVGASFSGPSAWTGDASPTVYTLTTFTAALSGFTPQPDQGTIYICYLTGIPTNGSNCFFNGVGPVSQVKTGTIYYGRITAAVPAGNATLILYDNLGEAGTGVTANALHYGSPAPAASAAWTMSFVQQVNPSDVAIAIKELYETKKPKEGKDKDSPLVSHANKMATIRVCEHHV